MKVSPSIRNSTLDKIQTPTAMLKEVELGVRNIASKVEESIRKRRDSTCLIPTNLCACFLTWIIPSKPPSLSTTYRLIKTIILQDYHSLPNYIGILSQHFLTHSRPSYYMVHPITQRTLHMTQYTHITQNTHIIQEYYSIGMIHKTSLQMHICVS